MIFEVPPTVLHVITRLGGGGAPLQVILLTRCLNNDVYPTLLLTGRCEASDHEMTYLLTPQDRVEWVPEMSRKINLAGDLTALYRLYRLMRATRPAIVHTHTAKAGALGRIAARLAGVPVVVHTYHGHIFSGYYSPLVSFGIRVVERMLAKLTSAICVLAPQQYEDVCERFAIAPPERVHIIPLGLDLQRFSGLSKLPRGHGILTVGWLGRFVGVKNVPLLLDIVEETLKRTDLVRFVIAGDGVERPLVESAMKRFGGDRLRWVGWQNDISTVLEECDCLIQTSRNEGTPVGLIEGMAAGLPFISTTAGGVVNMVSGPVESGQNGCRWYSNAILAEPDPAAFASALCELQASPDLLARMGCNASRFAIQNYDMAALARNHQWLYAKLLASAAVVPGEGRARLETLPADTGIAAHKADPA